MIKLCVSGYIPPKTFIGVQSFLTNLRSFKTAHDLVLFSEHDWPDLTVKLRISPETPYVVNDHNRKNLKLPHKFAINNVLFFTALRIAMKGGYTHMLYLETDVRVGRDHWDGIMFDEFFNLGRPLIAGGTLAAYNPNNWSLKASRKWCELVSKHYIRHNMPVATYGWKGAAEKFPSCVYPNGALGIYNVAWLHELFDLNQPAIKLAEDAQPFDMHLGKKIWQKFEDEAYDVIGHLTCIYSGYGDVITSEAERLAMLRSGKVIAVHQIKSEVK